MMDQIDENGTAATPGTPTSTIFLRDLTKVDCGLFDPAHGVIGQSWHVDLEVTGFTDANGFVHDFSQLKSLVRQVLKTTVDHALLMPIKSRSVQFQHTDKGEMWTMSSQKGRNAPKLNWTYTCPQGAVFPVRAVSLSKDTITQEISRTLAHRLPDSVTGVKMQLREQELDPTEATYRYTHGISRHTGQCQRLLHGHRCRIEVYVGGERRPDLEHYVARDILGSSVHIAAPSQIRSGPVDLGMRGETDEPVIISYETENGLYEASVPASRVFVVDHETSIESIARQLAQVVARRENSTESVRIVCYEGIDKGAIAEA